MSPKYIVRTEKHPGGREVEAESASRASQRTPGKTISVEEIGATQVGCSCCAEPDCEHQGTPLDICPPDCAVDHDSIWRNPAAAPERLRAVSFVRPPNPEAHGDIIDAPTPTAKRLERHAQLFGPEGVAAVAKEYGLTVDLSGAKSKQKPKKVKGASIKMQVFDLIDKGHDWEEVGDVFNLSPAKEKELRNEYLAKQVKEEAA